MSYEISNAIYKKLMDIKEVADSDFGEFENGNEEQLVQSISIICLELSELIVYLQRNKVELNKK